MCDEEILTLQLVHARANIEQGFAWQLHQRILAKQLNKNC